MFHVIQFARCTRCRFVLPRDSFYMIPRLSRFVKNLFLIFWTFFAAVLHIFSPASILFVCRSIWYYIRVAMVCQVLFSRNTMIPSLPPHSSIFQLFRKYFITFWKNVLHPVQLHIIIILRRKTNYKKSRGWGRKIEDVVMEKNTRKEGLT